MNSFYKYILFFILGIINYYFFKGNLIEGNIFSDISNEPSSINNLERGCLNYTCDSDHITYDNYQRKIYPSSDPNKPEIYDNCSNLLNEEYITSNPNFVSCSHEICCENRICKTEESNITCEEGQVFLPNKHCGYGITNAETCTPSICCSSTIDNTIDNSPSQEGLFEDIINFRNNKGGDINNGNNITGEDIRNYLYYSLLDLVAIDVVNNPLEEDSRRVGGELRERSTPENPPRNFKRVIAGNVDEGVFTKNCNPDDNYYQVVYNLRYPLLGNEYAQHVYINNSIDNSWCTSHGARTKSYPFFTNKENLEYIDYELLSGFFSNLRDDEIDTRIILISDLESDPLEIPENIRTLLSNISGINDPLTKLNIKQMIINLDKILNINTVNIKPLDRFFHTTINNYKNSLIDKNIFLGLINQ